MNNLRHFLFILIIILLISSGISGIIIPHRFFESVGTSITESEYQILPLQIKLISFGLSLFQIILGGWGFYKLSSKKEKAISIILIVLLTILYCFIIVPSLTRIETTTVPSNQN